MIHDAYKIHVFHEQEFLKNMKLMLIVGFFGTKGFMHIGGVPADQTIHGHLLSSLPFEGRLDQKSLMIRLSSRHNSSDPTAPTWTQSLFSVSLYQRIPERTVF